MSKKEKTTKRRLRIRPGIGLVLLAGVLVVVSVFVSISSGSKGAELVAIEQEMRRVEARNRQLRMEMVNESSLVSVAQKAEESGMIKPEKIVYLEQEIMKQASLARAD